MLSNKNFTVRHYLCEKVLVQFLLANDCLVLWPIPLLATPIPIFQNYQKCLFSFQSLSIFIQLFYLPHLIISCLTFLCFLFLSFGFNAYDFDDFQMANLAVKMFDELFHEERYVACLFLCQMPMTHGQLHFAKSNVGFGSSGTPGF